MKYGFLLGFVTLLIATAATMKMESTVARDAPVLYWVTDLNPARQQQVQIFQRWLATHHPETKLHLEIDTANRDSTKKIIQCVSGVGDDVMDVYGGGEVRYMQAMGVLADVSGKAQELGFGPDQTYAAIVPDICVPNALEPARQYVFPDNVTTSLFFVNRRAFAKFGLVPPPKRWSFADFERIGKQFVDAANPDPRHRTVFFTDRLETQKAPSVLDTMRRSMGLGMFNETGTRCILDRPENIALMELNYKWTYVDHLLELATSTETATTATMSDFAGGQLDMFSEGQYALTWGGRYNLIQFRQFNAGRARRGQAPLDIAVVEPPNCGFPNTTIVTRAAGVYAGSPNKDLAVYFLQFLASSDYNMEIVRDADSLPPNPAYTRVAAFSKPPDYPTEWGIHDAFADAANEIAIANSYSPFVLYSTAKREDSDAIDSFMSNQISASQAAHQAADRINAAIQRSLHDNPELFRLYDLLTRRQADIDRLRAQGKKVPLKWLTDPFYRKYYVARGWAE